MPRLTLTCLSAILLIGCSNLTAQLLPGEKRHSYTASYILEGQKHSFQALFTVKDKKVAQFEGEPQAATGEERAYQLAFFANVRRFILEKSTDEIAIPDKVGDASQALVDAFRGVVSQLQKDA